MLSRQLYWIHENHLISIWTFIWLVLTYTEEVFYVIPFKLLHILATELNLLFVVSFIICNCLTNVRVKQAVDIYCLQLKTAVENQQIQK